MRDPERENTMYMLRYQRVNYVSAYPLRTRVSAYPLQSTLRLFLREGWSSPLRIHVSAHPLHDQTTPMLFLEKEWSSPLRIDVSTLFREAPLKWQGILQLLPSCTCYLYEVLTSLIFLLKFFSKTDISSLGTLRHCKIPT